MPAVDPGFAQWLQAAALYAEAVDAGVTSAWGERAIASEKVSPLALKAGADAEAARQLAFLGGPNVIDRLSVPGLRADLIGQCVTLTADRLGYQAGVPCFVIGVAEADTVERTVLTVVRRLSP